MRYAAWSAYVLLMMVITISVSSASARGAVPGDGHSVQPVPSAQPAATPDGDKVEREVRQVFDAWSTALTKGDKKTYIDTFWDSPKLVIRVSDGEWRGIDAYRTRIERATLPPGNPAEYRNVQVVALGDGGAVVTYERPAPGQPSTTFRGTAVFIKTDMGWKIAAWHAHAVTAQAK